MGALAYSQVRNLVQLFLAQVILGLGCGTLGVTRAYVAESVPRESRTIMLGRLTAMQYAGLTMTSFLGSLLSKVGRRLSDDPSLAVFHFSPFTMAAYAVLGGALVALGTGRKTRDIFRRCVGLAKSYDGPRQAAS